MEFLGPVWWRRWRWEALNWGVWRPPKSLDAIVILPISFCGMVANWDSVAGSVLALWGSGWPPLMLKRLLNDHMSFLLMRGWKNFQTKLVLWSRISQLINRFGLDASRVLSLTRGQLPLSGSVLITIWNVSPEVRKSNLIINKSLQENLRK